MRLFGGQYNRLWKSAKLTDTSHSHLDHVGDPSTFPNSTTLVVGPGFHDIFLPGYPADPKGQVLESDYA